jgi:molybdopterin converting factor small subunit
MEITIKLFAYFRDDRFKVATSRFFEEGTTPAEVITSLGIKMDDVGVIMVNNRHADPDSCLIQDDVLAIFPKIGGG